MGFLCLQDCDAALVRRFDRRIQVPLPDVEGRQMYLEGVLARPELEADISSEEMCDIVAKTEGYSGADLAVLCRWAEAETSDALLQLWSCILCSYQ